MKATHIQIALGLVLTLASVRAQTFTVLKSFGILTNVTGSLPSGLAQGTDGTLYGTTAFGEANVAGTVFKVQPDGSGFTVLKRFTGPRNQYNQYPDGATPEAALTLSGSTLYGTTFSGGSSGRGTAFKLNTDGTGFTVLWSFTGFPDGANPQGALTLSGSTLYGMTDLGGSANYGTAFKLNTDGTGYTVLWSGPSPHRLPKGPWRYRTTRFTGRPFPAAARTTGRCSSLTPTGRATPCCGVSPAPPMGRIPWLG